jgi:DNA-binding MarR family transcriptional regulator
LIQISDRPGIRLGELADSLSKDQASTSTLIDRFMTIGLVRRETDAQDRRRALLYVTSQAEPIIHHLKDARDEVDRLVLDLLGLQDSEQLGALLAELLALLDRSEVKTTLQTETGAD